MRHAIIDVTDETGLIGFVAGLQRLGINVIASDGNADTLANAGISVLRVGEYTNSPGVMRGCLNNLHQLVFAGILAKEADQAELSACTIPSIDFVVANLQTKNGDFLEGEVEDVGVGRSALLQAGAVSARVTAVCNPSRYPQILQEMSEHNGEVSDNLRYRLAVIALKHLMRYTTATLEHLKESRQTTQQYFVPVLLGNRSEVPPSATTA